MKKITAFVLALGLLAPLSAQNDTIQAQNPKTSLKHSKLPINLICHLTHPTKPGSQ